MGVAIAESAMASVMRSSSTSREVDEGRDVELCGTTESVFAPESSISSPGPGWRSPSEARYTSTSLSATHESIHVCICSTLLEHSRDTSGR